MLRFFSSLGYLMLWKEITEELNQTGHKGHQLGEPGQKITAVWEAPNSDLHSSKLVYWCVLLKVV